LRKSKLSALRVPRKNLDQVDQFIALENQTAATNTVIRIIDRVENELSLFPSAGHSGRVDGTRENVFPDLPYPRSYL